MAEKCIQCGTDVTEEQVDVGEASFRGGDGDPIHVWCKEAWDQEQVREAQADRYPRKDPNYHTGFDQLAEKADDYRDSRGL